MKNIGLFYLLCLLAIGTSACLEDSGELVDLAAKTEAATIVVTPGGAVLKDVTDEVSIPIALTAMSDPTLVNSIDVILDFDGENSQITDKQVTNLATFPSEVKFSLNELLDLAGLTEEELSAGDSWNFSYLINNSLGDVWKVAGETVFTYTCPTDLAGTYDYELVASWCGSTSTGTVTIVDEGSGSYSFDDFSFGSYPLCYDGFLPPNWGELQFAEICGQVSFTGFKDAYGDVWAFSHSVNGTEWTVEWENAAYGESAKAVITNPDGWGFATK